MDNSGQNTVDHKGVLSAIAQRERELLAKVNEAEAAARRTVESARQEAISVASKAEAALADELDSMRRASLDKRAIERESILSAARQALDAERAKAEAHTDEAVREVVALVVPGNNS